MWYFIIGLVIVVFFGVKWWHDKKIREYREMVGRAKAAGCPMFSSDD